MVMVRWQFMRIDLFCPWSLEREREREGEREGGRARRGKERQKERREKYRIYIEIPSHSHESAFSHKPCLRVL